jgi:hypothetical protein
MILVACDRVGQFHGHHGTRDFMRENDACAMAAFDLAV